MADPALNDALWAAHKPDQHSDRQLLGALDTIAERVGQGPLRLAETLRELRAEIKRRGLHGSPASYVDAPGDPS